MKLISFRFQYKLGHNGLRDIFLKGNASETKIKPALKIADMTDTTIVLLYMKLYVKLIGGIPIDRGSDWPIIEKGPLNRGSDRPILAQSMGPF